MARQNTFFLTFCLVLAILLFLYPDLVEIGVGVAILLFGILNLEKGFRIFTEGPLRRILRRSTDNLFKSINLGLFSTAIMNSSSLISVLVISFISAELITLKAGIGVIFGSNIGTTVTGWLVALFGLKMDISKLALPMITFGILFMLQKHKIIKGWGYVTAGLGFFFLGIYYLKTGFDQYEFSLNLFEPGSEGLLTILTYTGIGILATIILQSSAASLAIILTALSVGQISYLGALALAIGSNIGTTFTALLASLAANPAGKKLALAHLIFNLITGIIALVFLPQLRDMVDFLTYHMGIDSRNYTLKLATFHTLFNIAGVTLMVPWVNQLIKLLNHVIKDVPAGVSRPRYLNKEVLKHPQSAIHALYRETENLLDKTFEIVAHSLNVHRKELLQTEKISELLKQSSSSIDIDINAIYHSNIKFIYSKIVKYITLVQTMDLTSQEAQALGNIKEANKCIVNVIKDLNDLRINLNQYMHSDNKYVRDTYNTFRKRLLKIIRELFVNIKAYPYQSVYPSRALEKSKKTDLDLIKKNIRDQKGKIQNLDVEIEKIITELITQDLIKSGMASSIWNDSIYVRRIGNNLLAITELLYTEYKDPEMVS